MAAPATLPCLALLPLWAGAAAAQSVPLVPPATQVIFTTYAMGLFPLPGHFTSFTGTLSVDPAHPGACTVALDVDAASLVMADPARARLATGPLLLDQPEFPHLRYQGSCANAHATGMLTMHGTTLPLTLTTRRDGDLVIAEGRLRRTDFGVNGLPGLVGRMIGITFEVHMPPALAALINP